MAKVPFVFFSGANDPIGGACAFSGHRLLAREELPRLKAGLIREIRALAGLGVREFVAGGALGFDTLAAQTVLELKGELPELRLVMAIPCRGQEDKWLKREQQEFRRLLDLADETIFLAEAYYNGCMQARNRFMVDRCRYLICYLNAKGGGTAYTVKYATAKERIIINLAEPTEEETT